MNSNKNCETIFRNSKTSVTLNISKKGKSVQSFTKDAPLGRNSPFTSLEELSVEAECSSLFGLEGLINLKKVGFRGQFDLSIFDDMDMETLKIYSRKHGVTGAPVNPIS